MMRKGGYQAGNVQTPVKQVHPIWRGFGCILLFIIPVMAYTVAMMIVEANVTQRWFDIPPELVYSLPASVSRGLPASVTNLFLVKLLIAVAISFLLFGIFTVTYSLVYRMSGGYRLGPTDVPPPKQRPKRRR